MDKFYLEIPSIERRREAIEYIEEFYEYGSHIHGTGSLDRELKNFYDEFNFTNQNISTFINYLLKF